MLPRDFDRFQLPCGWEFGIKRGRQKGFQRCVSARLSTRASGCCPCERARAVLGAKGLYGIQAGRGRVRWGYLGAASANNACGKLGFDA